MALSSGTKLGPYEIQSPLGAGGMGEVYRARDTRLDRTVAIKVLNSSVACSPELKQRFEREARIISRLNHPHICTLHDIGNQDGTDFLVMEYLEGETLAQRLIRGALSIPDLVKIAIDILDGLEQAHRAGVVHRDLKPGNVMLTKTGPKLLDFGLAKPSVAGACASGTSAPMFSAAQTISAPSPQSPISDVAGRSVMELCGVEQGRGGTWNNRGEIVFGTRTTGLFRVANSGGTPVPLTRRTAREANHRFPTFLPDGNHIVYVVQSPPRVQVQVVSMNDPRPAVLEGVVSNVVFSNGRIFHVRADGTLLAQGFDFKSLSLKSDFAVVAKPVA